MNLRIPCRTIPCTREEHALRRPSGRVSFLVFWLLAALTVTGSGCDSNPSDAVVAKSFGRIFYRNAINEGLPIFEIGTEVDKIRMGDRLRINVYTGEIHNRTTGIEIEAKPYPDFIMRIVEAGGIGNYIRSHKSEYRLLK